jgi:hypothetical protein
VIATLTNLLVRAAGAVSSRLNERPTIEAEAHLCTSEHILISWGGVSDLKSEQHVDVDLLFRKTRGGKVTAYELASATVNRQPLEEGWSAFTPVELEGGGTPVKKTIPFVKRGGRSPVEAAVGDVVELVFRSTHTSKPVRVHAAIRG